MRIVPLMSPTANLLEQYINEMGLNDAMHRSHPLFSNRMNNKLTRSGIKYILDKYVATARKKSAALFPILFHPTVLDTVRPCTCCNQV